jgi:phosphopantothenate---cysteine ligase (CTP)
MNCIITAGPTYESLDDVRRLTNFSTGRLGSELALFLTDKGHEVTLLIGEQATYRGEQRATRIEPFTTTANLRAQLETHARQPVDAVFHAAAVSDFIFGKVWLRATNGELSEIKSGKISTRTGTLMAELVPTTKIIASLREWYPKSKIVGWKFEVEAGREGVISLAEKQIAECRTDACVANGRAYGIGFGLVTGPGKCQHVTKPAELFSALEAIASK